jgi:predicted PurR-regulated permease PerM
MHIAIIPGVIGIFIAYLLIPIVKFFKKKVKKIWAVTITYIIFLAIVFVLFLFIIPLVYKEFSSIVIKLPFLMNKFTAFINDFIKNNTFLKNIELLSGTKFLPNNSFEVAQYFADKLNLNNINIFKSATSLTRAVLNVVLNFIIGPILGFYILKDSDKFITLFLRIIPQRRKYKTVIIVNRINNVFENYIRGQLIDAAIIALLVTIGMMILKVEFAMLIGVITFVFSLIPIIGSIIPVIPAAILAILSSPLKALIVIIIFIGVHLINYFFIFPNIMKNRTAVHPGLVLFSLIAGGALFGWFGIFLAIPVVAIFQEMFRYYIIEKRI